MLRPAIALSLLITGLPCAAKAFTAYVSNEKSNTISVVELDRMELTKSIPIGQLQESPTEPASNIQ